MTTIKLSVTEDQIKIDPELAKVPAGASIEFVTVALDWDIGVDFGDNSPFDEKEFYVDPGPANAKPLKADSSGTFRYTVTAGKKGPRDPVKRSRTADIEIGKT